MAKVIEHAPDDPDGPVNSGEWRIVTPAEAAALERLADALARAAAAWWQQQQQSEPQPQGR